VRYAAVSALSHDGLVRDHNEDSLVAGAFTLCASVTRSPQTLLFPLGEPIVVAVADGLGGHPAGELASSLVVQALARAQSKLTDEAAIIQALRSCNELIFEVAARDRERTAMGPTVAGIVLTGENVIVFNVGDSRVYGVQDAGLLQLSVDDNAPALGGRRSSVLTQTLGGSFVQEPVEPHMTSQPLATPARYLLCSDGLTDAVDDAVIAEILAAHDGYRAVFELWRATIEAGAPDNITVAVVEISSDPDG
jgi:serine/threonine protein phosphatase PrpC